MASSWVRRSVSGLFSNPPEAELFPVIFRRFPPAEPVGNTFCFVVRNFSGYFYFSRWPGGTVHRRTLPAIIGRAVRVLSRPAALHVGSIILSSSGAWSCLRLPTARSTLVRFVASVPGKDRRSLAFSRWPGRSEVRRMFSAPIGRVPLTPAGMSGGTFGSHRPLPPWKMTITLRAHIAFVASVPGKSRQSLIFGLYGFGVL